MASDANAAVGGAYYAMFYAARAALLHAGQAERAMGKTHSGMVAAFNEFLAHPGLVAPKLGKSFATEFAQRLAAAYTLDGVTDEDARRAVATADEFLAEVRALLASA